MALLVAGGAFCICSCSRKLTVDDDTHEGLMTQEAYDLTIIESTNGKLANRFETPLMETYEYAREPYREFRRGIKVTTYDSETNEIESTLVADYAIQFLDLQLWEAKGNVVATNAQGHVLETQQLFWNQRTERIYSNIDSKITQGTDVIYGVGFESDEQFMDWEFRKPRGTVDVDVESARSPGEASATATGDFDEPESGDGTDEASLPAESSVRYDEPVVLSPQHITPAVRDAGAEDEMALRRLNHSRPGQRAEAVEDADLAESERVVISQ